MATNTFPTDYTTKPTPDWTDVVWASDSLTNFNLTISSIALYTLTNSTTDNLPEWVTNLYYTDARVDNNATVQSKADKTNVLEKDNITAYTPTQQYHPATKDYVDSMWTDINWLTQKTTPVDADEFIIYDSVWLDNKKTTFSNIKDNILPNKMTDWVILDYTWNSNETVTYPHNLWSIPWSIKFDTFIVTESWSVCNWFFDWTNNKYIIWGNASWINPISWTNACIRSQSWSTHLLWNVTNVTDTSFDITWTRVWSPWVQNIKALCILYV